MKNPLPSLSLLVGITFVSPFALNVFNPAMPDVAADFGASISTVQLTISLYLFALGFSQLLCGTLADSFGRRPVLLFGIIVQLIGTVIAAFATSIEWLVFARVLQGLGGGASTVLVRTIILDVVDRDKGGKFLSYVSMAIAVTQLVAPTIGGYLNFYFSWRAIFYVSFAFNLPLALFVFYMLRETVPKADLKQLNFGQFLSNCQVILSSPIYLGYALCGALSTCAYLGFASVMPYIFNDVIGGNSAAYGKWFLVVSFGYLAGSFVTAQMTTRFGVDRLIFVGLMVAFCASLFILLWISSLPLLAAIAFIPMAFLTFGRGILYPNTQSGAISQAKVSRGTSSGLFAFIQLMLATTLTQAMPTILGFGVIYVFGTILATVLLAGAAHQFALFHQRKALATQSVRPRT